MKFKKAFLAGIVVSIAAYNYLLNYDIISKIVFSCALLVILSMNLNLFTSKNAGIILSDMDFVSKVKEIGIILLGNALACVIFGFLFSFLEPTNAEYIWAGKMETSLIANLYKGIIVGVLMQVAATCKHDLITIGAVLLFIGTGSEHSIANILYMSVARAFSFYSVVYICVTAIGNMMGSVMVSYLNGDYKKSLR